MSVVCVKYFVRNSDFTSLHTVVFSEELKWKKKVTRSICEFLNSKSEGGNVRVLLIYMRTRGRVF